MRRSKLEMIIDILTVLAHRGPLKLTHIMYRANVNCSLLKEYLEYLIQQGLVIEKTVGKKRVTFEVTPLGTRTLEEFNHLKEVLPIIEEARRGEPVPY